MQAAKDTNVSGSSALLNPFLTDFQDSSFQMSSTSAQVQDPDNPTVPEMIPQSTHDPYPIMDIFPLEIQDIDNIDNTQANIAQKNTIIQDNNSTHVNFNSQIRDTTFNIAESKMKKQAPDVQMDPIISERLPQKGSIQQGSHNISLDFAMNSDQNLFESLPQNMSTSIVLSLESTEKHPPIFYHNIPTTSSIGIVQETKIVSPEKQVLQNIQTPPPQPDLFEITEDLPTEIIKPKSAPPPRPPPPMNKTAAPVLIPDVPAPSVGVREMISLTDSTSSAFVAPMMPVLPTEPEISRTGDCYVA